MSKFKTNDIVIMKGSSELMMVLYVCKSGKVVCTMGNSEVTRNLDDLLLVKAWPNDKSTIGWNFTMSEAPRDGTPLQLLIRQDDDCNGGFDDNSVTRTIGFSFKDINDADQEWFFPGWSWCHDCITEQGHGTPIAWAHMLDIPNILDTDGPSQQTEDVCIEFTTDTTTSDSRCLEVINTTTKVVKIKINGQVVAVLTKKDSIFSFPDLFVIRLVTKEIPNGIVVSIVKNGIIEHYKS